MSDEKNLPRREALKKLGAVVGTTLVPPRLWAAQGEGAKASASGAATHAAGPAARRPNILWINAEGIPTRVLGCYGSTLMPTPNIDRIAHEGLRFHNAFCTNALCAPSRSTLLTGKYSHLTGMTANPDGASGEQAPPHFDMAQETFPKIMQRHGYQTTHAGKWHLMGDPGQAGFDAFIFKRWAGGPYYDPKGYLENPSPGSTVVKQTVHHGYTTDIFTDYTLRALERMSQSSKPFLMSYQPFNDHRPFDPPHRYEHIFDDVHFPEPGTFWDDYSMRASAAREARMRIAFMPDFDPPKDLTERQRQQWNYQRFMRHFMGALKALDENIGRLLDYLDTSGLAASTIVVFTTDHGFFMGDHGWFDKRLMYEQTIRIPWMIRWPGHVKAGSETDAWTINIDNAPTALDLAGLPVPEDMQGRSIAPLLGGTTPKDWKRTLYYHYYEFGPPHWVYPHYGVRTDRYKLINYYRQNEWELFDLEKDPDEMENLFAWSGYKVHEGYQGVVGDLLAKLKAARKQYKDDTGWPVKMPPTSSYD